MLIIGLTAFLTCYKIADAGYGNQYYTAAVKSMLSSPHNFFYAAFDSGFISVDKPALGLWLQCLFALIFGVKGWAVILPGALCSVGSVFVLYRLVRKQLGEPGALLASFFLAITPIFIAVSRTNNLDAPLVFVCLLAMLALMKAAERGSLGYLLLAAGFIGVGFNIKMLQAYMFLPAFYLVYFFSAPLKAGRRCLHLAAATVLLLAISLSWCLIVDLTPARDRPFVGSSTTNSTLELALGYNGLLRVLPQMDKSALNAISGAIRQVPNEGADPGPLRFFNREMSGQASWLLPLSCIGIIALLIKTVRTAGAERKPVLRQLLLWGGLFIPMYAYFCISGHIHRYYLIMFAPCLTALAAAAVTLLWSWGWGDKAAGKAAVRKLALPAALILTAAVQVYMLQAYYFKYAEPMTRIIVLTEAAALLLFLPALLIKKNRRAVAAAAAAVAVAGILATPAYWSYIPVQFGVNVVAPYAGPKSLSAPTNNGEIVIVMDSWEKKWFSGADFSGELVPREIVDYVLANDNGSPYLIAVPNVMFATPIILTTDARVMTLGGFTGSDKPLGIQEFNRLVQEGRLQYFYVLEFMESTDITSFVRLHGKKVDPALYTDKPAAMQFYTLYDLSGLKAG